MKLFDFMFLLIMLYAIGFLVESYTERENRCPYEEGECPSTQKYLRDYQLDYHWDTLRVWDFDRLVGIHIDTTSDDGYFHGNFIDSLIGADNE